MTGFAVKITGWFQTGSIIGEIHRRRREYIHRFDNGIAAPLEVDNDKPNLINGISV